MRIGILGSGNVGAALGRSLAPRLIRDLGFQPTDCGKLEVARYLEPFALLVAELAYNRGRSPKLGVRFMLPGS